MTLHEISPRTINVTEDVTLRLEADLLPEEDPAAMWAM